MSYRKLALHQTVVVNLDTGRAFRGALLKATGDVLVLANAELIESANETYPVPGTVVIERARVEFVQLVGK
jgi:small nuclear ribonucleoprotein (snRNP)-like protein